MVVVMLELDRKMYEKIKKEGVRSITKKNHVASVAS